MHVWGAVFAWVCTVILAAVPLYAEPQQVKVLYRKQLPKNGELVIAQQPLVRGNAFRELLGTRSPAELGASAFALVCELHSPGQPPLLLYSHVYPCWKESDYAGYEVLDVMVRPDQVVFVVADAWSDIAVIEIGSLARCRIGGPNPSEWSLLGATSPTRPGRLHAKLAYDDASQSVEIEITDSLEGNIQHTLFRQNRAEWTFAKVRQWQEKDRARAADPTTAPATAAPVKANDGDLPGNLTVFGDNTWYVRIDSSGGGVYGFGDGGPPFDASFASGTFQFRDTAARLLAASQLRDASGPVLEAPPRHEAGVYGVSVRRHGSTRPEARDTRDVALIRQVFENAIKSAPPGPELGRALATRPPVPTATTLPAQK